MRAAFRKNATLAPPGKQAKLGGTKMGKRTRSAITGRFVKESTGKRNPKTTVVETVKKDKK